MSLTNILVHLDGGARTAERLGLAVALAAAARARLVGVFAQTAPGHHVGVVARWPSDEYQAQAQASRDAFAAAAAGLDDAEWMDLNRGGEVEVSAHFVRLARHFDLTVLGQRDPEHPAPAPAELCEDTILGSGRPALVVPYAGHFASVGQRPLLAWHDAAAAARALNDALPLLDRQGTAQVVSVSRHAPSDPQSVAQILTHLGRHGLAAHADHMVVEDEQVMDALLNRAADHGADLLVMGASGGAGLPFLHRGSGTRYILRHMTVPVLLSH